MSEKLPNMIQATMEKLKEMVDVNSVIGQPIQTPDGVTIIPVCKVSVGYLATGLGEVSNNSRTISGKCGQNPGAGFGTKVTPICFLVVKDGNVRMMSVPTPANSTADRIVEMLPDTLDKISAFLDAKKGKQE